MDKVNKCISDVERKLTKLNAITVKGAANLTIKDVIKASRKGNSIQNTIKKGAKEVNVYHPLPSPPFLFLALIS
jgi:hypothetical protein